VNASQFEEFDKNEIGFLRFVNWLRFRLGRTNDEGWYRGQCRFSEIAPEWGKLYEIFGDDTSTNGPTDWCPVSTKSAGDLHHFLFYFRDNTFESVAERCVIMPLKLKESAFPALAVSH
jgi:hypothetical protein